MKPDDKVFQSWKIAAALVAETPSLIASTARELSDCNPCVVLNTIPP
jgi:hypothetical protein